MHDAATRATAGPRRSASLPGRDLWRSVPLECFVCAAAILLAAGLKLTGLMP
ncbi:MULTISPECIES: hypothetical protein [Methylobacterium]|uniref:Uncharacterized protein n=1 Tax=Methylobacterium jeotgali TaxID=381630 RepID=A0ABQ4SRE1_9HYPH|nr:MULTISPECIES: hypothetical protein [Methylobacterium]GBU18104.1 hypothetical protein AwMethylo_23190 [Methylobacterium sp.]GJE05074.1 hypothetical protein AOPFMNJM_0369 [Methylobacterium jeotgali]